MATIADYLVLGDTPIQLSVALEAPHGTGPQSKFYKFDLPNTFVAEAGQRKPVLMFRTTVLDDDTRVEVHVNPENTETTSSGFPSQAAYFAELRKGYFGLHMEALDGRDFKKGQENTIVIRVSGDVDSHFGDVIIGDVVFLIQREV